MESKSSVGGTTKVLIVCLLVVAAGASGYAVYASHERQQQLHQDEVRRAKEDAANATRGAKTAVVPTPDAGDDALTPDGLNGWTAAPDGPTTTRARAERAGESQIRPGELTVQAVVSAGRPTAGSAINRGATASAMPLLWRVAERLIDHRDCMIDLGHPSRSPPGPRSPTWGDVRDLPSGQQVAADPKFSVPVRPV